MSEAAFEIIDALGGLCTLERRSPSLDGSLPLRVVQGCVPFLEGTAFGYQLSLSRAVTLRRTVAGASVEIADRRRGHTERLLTGNLPRLIAQGFFTPKSPWPRLLTAMASPVGPPWQRRLRLFTGLLVRPKPGLWLRCSSAENRRNLLIEVDEQFIAGDRFVPLMLTLSLRAGGDVTLEGEIGCLAPFAPRAAFSMSPIEQAPELGRAHCEFYDEGYFRDKREGVTKKYRTLVAKQPVVEAEGAASCDLVTITGEGQRVSPVGRVVTAESGPEGQSVVQGDARLERVVFSSPFGFEASYDGHTVRTRPDGDELVRAAIEIEATMRRALGDPWCDGHRGAIWYLTKYFTPHPPGEPHFFVKPLSFVRTPPGWSCVLDGVHRDGFDVLRGVISTDRFHALPVVFSLRQVGKPMRIEAGEELLTATPVPRRLLEAGFDRARFRDGLEGETSEGPER